MKKSTVGLSLSALLWSQMAMASGGADAPPDAEAETEAEQIHEQLITLDTHLDTPSSLDRPGWSILERHDGHEDYTQVDLPRMKQGGLDGGFWAIYTPQGPLDAEHYDAVRDFAVMRGVSIREMVAASPGEFALATEADDAATIAEEGKRIVYMSIENAYPLGEDLSLLDLFYDMGVRLLGFAHFSNNQFADSSTDPDGPKWNGLSPLGKKLLAKANSMGIIVDASHSSDDVLDQMLDLSTSPIILSHSGSKAVYDHPRNIDDAHLRRLAEKGGVIQINSYGSYLREIAPNPERRKALGAIFGGMSENMSAEEYDAMLAGLREVDEQYPKTDEANFKDFMKHLLHALEVAGVDHVGIGLDWDGGGGVAGMEDVASIPMITEALLEAGYDKEDIQKIWSGNVLRVMREVQANADQAPAEESDEATS